MPFSSISMLLNQPMKQVIINQNQRPMLHSTCCTAEGTSGQFAVKEREAHKTSSRSGGKAAQRNALLQDSDDFDSCDPFAELLGGQSFLRRSTPATPSHKTAALIINIAY